MNSFFSTLLNRYDIPKHDGRPLWKYNLTDEDYIALKETISKANRSTIDPKDLALLYAEWWKNEYEGGFPTKRRVYELIENCSINEDDFYALAKQGAVMLGVKWIQRGKRLFFRTLLLQGGVPVNHMINNSGQYTNFLKKVMELNPDSIEEFAYDTDLTKLLPTSSRNEDVYESCLQIVQAIWNGNEEYIAILEKKQQNENNSIAKQLKDHKSNIEKTLKRRTNFKAFWVLDKDKNGTSSIHLKFNLPQVIEKEGLAQILELKDISNLQTEYHLLVDDKLLAKLKRNVAGNYKVFLFNNATFKWDGEQLNPDIRIRSALGNAYPLPILTANAPDLSQPTLWIEKSDSEWILVKGQSCKQDEAFVLYDSGWNLDKDIEHKNITLYERDLKFVKFSDSLTLTFDNDEPVIFRTKAKSFQWVVHEHKPGWLLKSNIPVIKGNAQIIVYNEDGSKINNAQLNWRLTGSRVWQSWVNNMPVGSIEYKVTVNGLEEKGHFYNIGAFSLETHDSTADHAEFYVINTDNLYFKIEEVDSLSINYNVNSLKIALADYTRMPKSIKAKLRKQNQVRAFYFEIAQPFTGVKILDPEGNVKGSDDMLLLGNFNGYRIFAPVKNNYLIRMYNQGKPDIKIIKKLPGGTRPLREYDEEVYKLIRLTDSMDNNTAVRMEFFETIGRKDEILGEYVVKSFNKQIEYSFDNDRVIINISGDTQNKLNLFAIPLECSPGNIEIIPLQKEERGYIFPDIFLIPEKFIVVSELINNTDIIKPAFVSTNSKNESTTLLDKAERIEKEKEKLIESFDYWEKIHKYFDFCVQLELPFTTFDIFRAALKTPDLTAKLFCYLCVNAYSDTFLDTDVKNLEEDLGVCFHWIPLHEWSNAINWLENGLKTNKMAKDEIDEILILVQGEVIKMIEGNEPNMVEKGTEKIFVFKEISEYVQTNKVPNFKFSVLNVEINDLRRSLGEKALNELPDLAPSIPDQFKSIIPVDKTNWIVKVLLKVPVSVALSISEEDTSLWEDGENWAEIRRNIQFVQWLTPQWYGLAILHSLNRIHNL